MILTLGERLEQVDSELPTVRLEGLCDSGEFQCRKQAHGLGLPSGCHRNVCNGADSDPWEPSAYSDKARLLT